MDKQKSVMTEIKRIGMDVPKLVKSNQVGLVTMIKLPLSVIISAVMERLME